MRVLMLLLLIQSSWSVKASETGQGLDNVIIDETLEDTGKQSKDIPFPEGGFQENIYFVYNTAALEKYGKDEAERKVHRVYEYLKRWLHDGSLGTSINLTLAGIGYWPIQNNLEEVKKIVPKISALVKKELHHVALFAGEMRGKGRSVTGTLCGPPSARVSMCGFSKNDYGNARKVIHEMGHTFGLTHGNTTLPCGIHRIMETGSGSTKSDPKFSNCSRISFLNYFNKEGGRSGRFCLPLNDCYCNPKGSVSQFSCTGDYDYCTCKPGFLGPRCDQCWPYTKKVVTGRKDEVECGRVMKNARINGGNLKVIKHVVSFEACHQLCVVYPDCSYWSYMKTLKRCWLKGMKPMRKDEVGAFTGTRICAENAANITDCIEKDAIYEGYNIGHVVRESPLKCLEFCRQTAADCDAWVWKEDNMRCFRKGMRAAIKYDERYVSGPKNYHQI